MLNALSKPTAHQMFPPNLLQLARTSGSSVTPEDRRTHLVPLLVLGGALDGTPVNRGISSIRGLAGLLGGFVADFLKLHN